MYYIPFRLADKVVDVLSTRHGAWSANSSPKKTADKKEEEKVETEDEDEKEFWKLDVWEDDARRRRR